MSRRVEPVAQQYISALMRRGDTLEGTGANDTRLASFRAAILEGANAIESDVHATSDGVVLMFHDPTLDRTTTGKGLIREQPWAGVIESVCQSYTPSSFVLAPYQVGALHNPASRVKLIQEARQNDQGAGPIDSAV